jgi:oligopeptidase B
MGMFLIKRGSMIIQVALLSVALFFIEACPRTQRSPEAFAPPIAKKMPKELSLHGHTRIDDYYWLRERDDPEVAAYLEAENDYTKKVMARTEDLQATLIDEFRDREQQPNLPIPYRKGDYFYYERFAQGSEYPVYFRKKGSMDADEDVILDAGRLAAEHDVFWLAPFQVSPAQDILAFGIDTHGDRDFFTFFFIDLKTGELLPDLIPDIHPLTAWSNDNRTFFYIRNNRMYSHCLGTALSDDKFYVDDVSFLSKTKSNRYILLFSTRYPYDWKGYVNADDPQGRIREIVSSQRGIQCFRMDHRGDKFYFLEDGRLKEIPVTSTKLDQESGIIFSRGDVEVEHFEVFEDHLVLWEKKNGMTDLRIISFTGGRDHDLVFSESIYSVSSGQPRSHALRNFSNSKFNSHVLRFGYSSPTVPDSIYEYDMETKKRVQVWPKKTDPAFDPNSYRTERLWAKAEDGAQIPISLVYRKEIKEKGASPLLLTGYGMYGVSEELRYNSERLSLLDRGFVCAIAHVRGGGELPDWHQEGMLLKKMNSFTDFITCARYLVDNGYADPDGLFAWGSSGGGLLMAGVVTIAPELFKGVIIEVPFLDIITTMIEMIDEIQRDNRRELGDPDEMEYYESMLAYAPYDNIEARQYPNLLVTAGFLDAHVHYWPAAKFVAKMRAMKTDPNLVLLKTYMTAGHDTASGRSEQLRKTAFLYAFILDLAGIRR